MEQIPFEPPKDLKRAWLNVARRMQSAASKTGYSIMSITVFIGPDGCPKLWTEPRVVKVEPRQSEDVVAALLGNDPQNML